MRWYFAKRGNIREHGIIDDSKLREMARSGALAPDDMLWNESTAVFWIRAAGVRDLFPEPEQKTETRLKRIQQQPQEAPQPQVAAPPRKSKMMIIVGAVVGAIILVVIVGKLLKLF